jgi:hypothetical protein
MPLKDLPSSKLNNIWMLFWPIKDVFPTENIMVESEEPVKPPNSEKPPVDGLKNQSESSSVWLTTYKQTPTLKTWKTWPSNTFKSIELPKEEEELTELTVESVLICHVKLTSKCGPTKSQLTSKEKAKPDKSLKEKSPSENNDLVII